MNKNKIWDLPVISKGVLLGLIHMNSILKKIIDTNLIKRFQFLFLRD